MLNERKTLTMEIRNAENLHGHLGPFLVIGVKIARLAKKHLKLNSVKQKDMQITAMLPLLIPFSCIIDGIQATTQCTVGNRKLKIKNSKETVKVNFRLKNPNRTLKIHVNPKVLETLKDQLSKGASNEELAWKIAFMPESQLLRIGNR
ncbi:MAG: formylmethanofuran dehydrogenase subunit E family protein [Candidatus Bathyarchaeia archaeon]